LKSNMAARVHNVFSLAEILKIFLSETTKSIELWLCRNDRTTDAYPWQKLTWPMARWAKKIFQYLEDWRCRIVFINKIISIFISLEVFFHISDSKKKRTALLAYLPTLFFKIVCGNIWIYLKTLQHVFLIWHFNEIMILNFLFFLESEMWKKTSKIMQTHKLIN
jgi:hypothetical protein